MRESSSPTRRRAPRVSHGHAGRALAVPVLALVTGWTGLAVPAHAADQASPSGTTTTQEPAGVRVGGRARSTKDGSVRVHLRARCPATYQAFELDVAVLQDRAFGSFTQLAPPPVVVCDGTVHSRTAMVAPEVGSFRPGPATVNRDPPRQRGDDDGHGAATGARGPRGVLIPPTVRRIGAHDP